MPTLTQIMTELKSKGKESYRKIYARHGNAIEKTFGVSNADLKAIAKTIRRQQDLAYQLYDTGNMDAMYLAGIVVEGAQMTRQQLQAWATGANGLPMIAEHTVPWVTVENADGRVLALEWIESSEEHVASAGWATYSGLIATTPDEVLDLPQIEDLLDRVVREIDGAPNRVKSRMNSFVIAVGTYVKPLSAKAKAAAHKIGVVAVDVGDTECQVPVAVAYIEKAETAGKVGVKKKTIRC